MQRAYGQETRKQGRSSSQADSRTPARHDLVLAAMSATEPLLFGFARDEEAAFFYGSGPGVVSVVATTDWNAGQRKVRRRERAA